MTSDWWRRAVFYQIYPRSFADANGDGIGDLDGITAHLDYLNDGTARSLGIDALWLSPINPSPLNDWGYDVSDYCGVHPDLGDLGDVRSPGCRGASARHQDRPRPGAESHLGSAPMVSRVSFVARKSEARLVHLEARGAGSSAQQLGQHLRRSRVEIDAATRPMVPASVPRIAARSELPQSRGRRRDAKRDALLARSRRRRVSRRCGPRDD